MIDIKGVVMETRFRFAIGAVAVLALLGLGGCGAGMLDKNAAIGPVEGGVPGSTRMIGGPAIGGAVGRETERPR
jgi:hypothetical protein